MLRRYARLYALTAALAILSLTNTSIAGDVYGKVGYGHHPFHIVVGYSGHNKHHYHKHYKPRKHYYVPRHHHYRHHVHYYGHKRYYSPRRYCRTRY